MDASYVAVTTLGVIGVAGMVLSMVLRRGLVYPRATRRAAPVPQRTAPPERRAESGHSEQRLPLLEAELAVRRRELDAMHMRYEERLHAQIQEIQQFMTARASLPELGERVEVALHSEDFGEISGDLPYYRQAPDGGLNFALMDAMGHGPAAGMLTTMAWTTLLVSDPHDAPETVARRLHEVLARSRAEGYLTAVIGHLSPCGQLSLVHCGHPISFICRADADLDEPFGESGEALGLADWKALSVRTETTQLRAGDRLFLYTDGLSEARRPDDSQFTDAALRDSCLAACRRADRSAQDVVFRAFEAVYDWISNAGVRDDMTLMCIRFVGDGLPRDGQLS